MKKGITAYGDYDKDGRYKLVIEKSRGTLTLEDIRETAREYNADFYLLVMDAFSPEYDEPAGIVDEPTGDRAVLYLAEDLLLRRTL